MTRDGMRLATSVQEAIAMLSAGCENIVAADAPTMICVNAAPRWRRAGWSRGSRASWSAPQRPRDAPGGQ